MNRNGRGQYPYGQNGPQRSGTDRRNEYGRSDVRRDPYGSVGARQGAMGRGQYPPQRGNTAPRQNPSYGRGYADARRDPRYADPRNPRGYADPRGYGQSAGRRDSRSGYNGRDPYGYGQQQRDPRVEAYLRAQREEKIRRERARRAELERRRAIEREKLRRLEERLKKERKMRRKRARKIFCGRAVVSLIIFAILLAVTSVGLAIHFHSTPDAAPSKVVYTFGGKSVREVSEGTAFREGKMYVCFNDVADYIGLYVTGDVNSMKFIFPEEDSPETGSEGSFEESVVFMTDSRTVIINSRTVTLPAESFLYGEEIWVSTEFLSEYVDGLDVTLDGKTVKVARITDEELTTDEETVYLDVSLKLKSEEPLDSDGEGENGSDTPVPDAPIEFATDLSAYEQYMDPENGDEYLVLVNNTNRVDASFAPTDLVYVVNTRQDGRETQLMRDCAEKALEAMFIEMNAAGYTDVSVMSGYRAYATQEYLHNTYINNEMAANPALTWEEAKAIVLTYSADPGTSEHQTGLCVDMHNLPSADVSFANEEAYTWLCDNAWKFGFVLRFPENKTDVTGITFEPWHWRFVGREHAKAMYYGNMCLEEYVASLGE